MSSGWRKFALLLALLPLLCCVAPRGLGAQDAAAPVYVTLWFDTEDYILPQSDDAAKRLAEILTRLDVRATFKVVGEKARVLERRGRTDVIRALQKHDIGYHSNWHSRQPTVAVYLGDAGWDDGIAEFLRREGSGAADVRRIFGTVPVCYGQPGSSWAPQAYPALRSLGITMYLDEARHVGLNGQPFFYGGMLNVFNLGEAVVRLDLDGAQNLANARQQFLKAREAVRARGGGTLSIYYHPCEFVHKEFWDGVNFSRGNNPPPEDWKLPPTKPAAAVEKGFADFEQYVRFIKELPGVRFVTASDLKQLYADPAAEHRFGNDEIRTLARGVGSGVTFQQLDGLSVSAAEVFWLLQQEAMKRSDPGKQADGYVTISALDGPARPFAVSGRPAPPRTVPWASFAATVADVDGFCRSRRRVPDEVWLGAVPIPPETYLATIAALLEETAEKGRHPEQVRIMPGTFTAAKYVAQDSGSLWDWVIFPEGFRAPAVMELARLQAWTLKPARLKR